jgi:hypothetical protein
MGFIASVIAAVALVMAGFTLSYLPPVSNADEDLSPAILVTWQCDDIEPCQFIVNLP